MLEKVLQLLSISCRHSHISQPFHAPMATGARRFADWEPITAGGATNYVVCLDCGKQFAYDWTEMRVVRH